MSTSETTRSASSQRRLAIVAALLGVAALPISSAHADATAALTATAIGGTLTVAGAGTATGNVTPGVWTSLTGATLMTVADLRGSTAGWHVTAQYQAPVAGIALGGANIRVTTGNAAGDALSNVHTFSGVTLGSAATVLNSYGAGATPLSGAGISTADASFEVKAPSTAQTGEVYAGTVVFTVTTG